MQLTKDQDYAIRIIFELCRADGKRLDVGTIASLTGVTPLFTQKIMRKLSAANIVTSKKGANGGYVLAEGRNASNTTLYDVFKAMNGSDLFINGCLSGSYICTRPDVVKNHGTCVIRKAVSALNDNIIKSLKAVTFDELL